MAQQKRKRHLQPEVLSRASLSSSSAHSPSSASSFSSFTKKFRLFSLRAPLSVSSAFSRVPAVTSTLPGTAAFSASAPAAAFSASSPAASAAASALSIPPEAQMKKNTKKKKRKAVLQGNDALNGEVFLHAAAAGSAPAEGCGTPAAVAASCNKQTNSSSAPSSLLLDVAASPPAALRVNEKQRHSVPLTKKRRRASAVPTTQSTVSSSISFCSSSSSSTSSFSSGCVMEGGQEPRAAAKQWKKVLLDSATLRVCQMEGMTELEELDGTAACIFNRRDQSQLNTSLLNTSTRRATSSSARPKKTTAAAPPPAAALAAAPAVAAACKSLSGTAVETEESFVCGVSAAEEARAAAARETLTKQLKTKLQQQKQQGGTIRVQQQQDIDHQQQRRESEGMNEESAAAGDDLVETLSTPKAALAAGAPRIDSSSVTTERSRVVSSSRSKNSSKRSCERGRSNDSKYESSSKKKKGSFHGSEKREPRPFGRNCSLEESTEHWSDVVELREKLQGWVSLVEAQGEEDSLHPAVLRALLEGRFVHPTPVQQAVLLQALRDRRDVIAAAETGSGKTLAYGVPIVCCLLSQMLRRKEKALEKKQQLQLESIEEEDEADAGTEKRKKKKKQKTVVGAASAAAADANCSSKDNVTNQVLPFQTAGSAAVTAEVAAAGREVTADGKEPREMSKTILYRREAAAEGEVEGPECLVLVPSRELAAQVQQHLSALCIYTPIRCVCLVGGLSVQKQQRLLAQKKPQILVATPGRLCALLKEAQEAIRIRNFTSSPPGSRVAAWAAGLSTGGIDDDNGSLFTTAAAPYPRGKSPAADPAAADPAAAGSVAAGSVAADSAAAVGSAAVGLDGGGLRRRLQEEAQAYLSHLNTLRFLVLDEADRLVKHGSFADLDVLLEAVYAATSSAATREVKKQKSSRPHQQKASGTITSPISDNADEDGKNAAAVGSGRKTAAAAADGNRAGRSSSSRLQTFVLSATLGLSEEELLLRARGRAGGREKRRAAAAEAEKKKQDKKKKRNSSSDESTRKGKKEEELPAAKGIQQLMERVRLNTSRLCIVDLCSSSGGTPREAVAAAAEGIPAALLSTAEEGGGRREETAAEGRIQSNKSNAVVLHGGLVKLPDGLQISCLKTANEEEELSLAMLLLKLFLSTPVEEACKILIFVNAISYVYRLDPLLSIILGSASADRKHPSTPVAEVFGLHAQLQQKQRIKRMERFQAANRAVLVCTDVASRGLDLHDVKHVVHFQAPRTPSLFVHRSGRTARAKQTGESICVCSPAQVEAWLRVAKPLQIDLAALPAPQCLQREQQTTRGFYSQLAKMKKIFSLATQIESARHQNIKERRTTSWMKKAAAAADILLESDMSDEECGSAQAKKIKGQQKELSQLLSSLKFAKASTCR